MRSTLFLALVAVVVVVSGADARSSASADAAADVRLLAAKIEELHPAPFRSVSRERFQSEVNTLARTAPELSRNELLVGILRVLALLGPRNGHTGLFPADPGHESDLHLYPLRLYQFSDGLHVVDAVDEVLIGSRVVAVEGTPIEQVLRRVEPLVPRDNDSNLRGLAPHFALVAEVLDGLGVVEGAGPAEFTLESRSGERTERTLTPLAGPRYGSQFADSHFGHYPSALPRAPRPLYLAGSAKPMWVRTLARGRAVYVGYNSVRSPTPAFLRALDRLRRGKKVGRVVVDVRLNGGGDNTTYGALLTAFQSKAVNRPGRLYLLIGRATFSAAGNFSAELERSTRAIVVGEPTGGGVETYGDTVPVLLVEPGWLVHIAGRYHERKRGPGDRRLAVEPDVRIDLTSAQYFAGRDPVLERALKGL